MPYDTAIKNTQPSVLRTNEQSCQLTKQGQELHLSSPRKELSPPATAQEQKTTDRHLAKQEDKTTNQPTYSKARTHPLAVHTMANKNSQVLTLHSTRHTLYENAPPYSQQADTIQAQHSSDPQTTTCYKRFAARQSTGVRASNMAIKQYDQCAILPQQTSRNRYKNDYQPMASKDTIRASLEAIQQQLSHPKKQVDSKSLHTVSYSLADIDVSLEMAAFVKEYLLMPQAAPPASAPYTLPHMALSLLL